jgi:predicted DNA-binding transcriptional regulator YafY
MDKFDRFQQLHRLLNSRKLPVSLRIVAEKLECSEATARRCIYNLRDIWQAPIEYNNDLKGWHYQQTLDDKYELPGLWLTADELQALSALLAILESLDDNIVGAEFSLVSKSINNLLQARDVDVESFVRKIKYLPMAKRQINHSVFSLVSSALLNNMQLDIRYRDYKNSVTNRAISPQTLIYYRENWHLDAWCHLRNELRTFVLARIDHIADTKDKAKQISQNQLAEHYIQAYGIFSGKASHVAELVFYDETARDVAQQQWHPQQQGEWQIKDREYRLKIPYNNPNELMMDILKFGNNVEVIAPANLRKAVTDKLHAALSLYSNH